MVNRIKLFTKYYTFATKKKKIVVYISLVTPRHANIYSKFSFLVCIVVHIAWLRNHSIVNIVEAFSCKGTTTTYSYVHHM
jgi:hypothetical protein